MSLNGSQILENCLAFYSRRKKDRFTQKILDDDHPQLM